jgi:hypothetical protein
MQGRDKIGVDRERVLELDDGFVVSSRLEVLGGHVEVLLLLGGGILGARREDEGERDEKEEECWAPGHYIKCSIPKYTAPSRGDRTRNPPSITTAAAADFVPYRWWLCKFRLPMLLGFSTDSVGWRR